MLEQQSMNIAKLKPARTKSVEASSPTSSITEVHVSDILFLNPYNYTIMD